MGRGRWFIEFPGGGGVVKKRESPDFRSPEVGISADVVSITDSQYGNPTSGWHLYDSPRIAIEASDVCFVQRRLMEWQVSLA